ncbi:MAG: hypothetical protein ACYDAJ_02845 [Nitrosotalea sp.]
MKTVLQLDDHLLTVLQKIGKLRDDTNVTIDLIEIWVISLFNQTEKESKIKKDRCEICNSKEDKKDLQLNHIAGRKHDFRMITVCVKCHEEISKLQRLWDIRWLDQDIPDNLKDAFFLQGLYDILLLKSKMTRNSLYEQLGKSLIEETSQLLKVSKIE